MPGVVIIGGGIAAVTTAQELRRAGYSERVVVLSEEEDFPYDRPSLSKQLLDRDRVPLCDSVTLADAGIELVIGHRVSELGPDGAVAGGQTFAGSHYVLATGAEAIRPEAIPAFPNVHVLRSAEDARWLRLELDQAEDVLLVGGGLVNSEIASVLCGLDQMQVHLVDPVLRPLSRLLGAAVGSEVHRRMSDAGVRVRQGMLERVASTGRSLLAFTDDGERQRADGIVVGVGARPRVELALQIGAEVGDGVLCDGTGRTSVPQVFAVGDVASWPYQRFGRHRTGHWKSAVDQAAIVARTIAGPASAPMTEPFPWFWTEQFGLRAEVAGIIPFGGREHVLLATADACEVLVEGADGEIQAVIGMNSFQACRRFRQGKQWETVA